MNNPQYQAIIRSAAETRNIDFKAGMNWGNSTRCERFEILKDIAALANVGGGGHIIIGRDEPALTSGSLTQEQADSFDPTKVNAFVHRYLSPAIECRVETEIVDGDLLVVIGVPEFDISPVIFQETGNCGASDCRKSPHFRAADIFVRSKAQQSQRVDEPDDMRDILKRGMLKSQDDLLTSIQRLLSSPVSVEEPLPVSPYDAEYEHERQEFFGQAFSPWVPSIGHFDMVVKPAVYREERIDLHCVPTKIREYAYVLHRNGMFDSVPYQENYDVTNFSGGCRMLLSKPEWQRYEGVSLYQSGLYRIVRMFMEDHKPNEDRTSAELVQQDRSLWLDAFIEQITMFHLLARNIARDLLQDQDEEIQIDLRVDGLAQRTLTTNKMEPELRIRLGYLSTFGSENVFQWPLRTTLRAFEVDAVKIARERCEKILWTFGLRGGDGLVMAMQRALLGRAESVAFPLPQS